RVWARLAGAHQLLGGDRGPAWHSHRSQCSVGASHNLAAFALSGPRGRDGDCVAGLRGGNRRVAQPARGKTVNQMTLQEKKRMLQEWLESPNAPSMPGSASSGYRRYTYDMFLNSVGSEPAEAQRFSAWIGEASRDGIYAFESARLGPQKAMIRLRRET